MINCNLCKHLNITEEQQQTFKYTDHICVKYNTKVIHRSSRPKIFHDYIYPCIKCEGKDFKLR